MAEETARVVGGLLHRFRQARPDDLVPALVATLAQIDVTDVALYAIDYEVTILTRLPGGTARLGTAPDTISVDGTPVGEAFREQTVLVRPEGDRLRAWLPVVDGADGLGVLTADCPTTDAAEEACEMVVELLAHLLSSAERFTDAVGRRFRRHDMALAAEMQWSLLPPVNFACDAMRLSALVAPAYNVGGDAFDYACNGEYLSFTIIDSMGHGLAASMAASLAVGSYRNRRRAGASLIENLMAMDDSMASQFVGDQFATVQMGTVHLPTGRCQFVNAGHPLPLLVRGGDILGEVECPPSLPVGLGVGNPHTAEITLEHGDRLLFYSDGIFDARSPEGVAFGEVNLLEVLSKAVADDLSCRDVVRRLIGSVIVHQVTDLRDDATVLLLERP